MDEETEAWKRKLAEAGQNPGIFELHHISAFWCSWFVLSSPSAPKWRRGVWSQTAWNKGIPPPRRLLIWDYACKRESASSIRSCFRILEKTPLRKAWATLHGLCLWHRHHCGSVLCAQIKPPAPSGSCRHSLPPLCDETSLLCTLQKEVAHAPSLRELSVHRGKNCTLNKRLEDSEVFHLTRCSGYPQGQSLAGMVFTRVY